MMASKRLIAPSGAVNEDSGEESVDWSLGEESWAKRSVPAAEGRVMVSSNCKLRALARSTPARQDWRRRRQGTIQKGHAAGEQDGWSAGLV